MLLRRIRTDRYNAVDVVVLCFAMNRAESFENLEAKWLREIKYGDVIFLGARAFFLDNPLSYWSVNLVEPHGSPVQPGLGVRYLPVARQVWGLGAKRAVQHPTDHRGRVGCVTVVLVHGTARVCGSRTGSMLHQLLNEKASLFSLSRSFS